MIHPNYPTPDEIDIWCQNLSGGASSTTLEVAAVDAPIYSFSLGVRHNTGTCYLKFTTGGGQVFYGFWQPVYGGGPAPLLVHLPGYGAEMSAHPELVAEGYNVLHINPMGYATPTGPDGSKLSGGDWPVLPDTVATYGEKGYCEFLSQALCAVRWAKAQPCVQPDRIGFFGTSQGGGTALLAASLLAGEGVKAVAADVPFLTNYPMVYEKEDRGAYGLAFGPLKRIKGDDPQDLPKAWRALGFIDTLSHAHRLTMPVLLTAGSADNVTPKDTIKSLFEALPGTRSFTELAGQGHAYTTPFLHLAKAWFRLYV